MLPEAAFGWVVLACLTWLVHHSDPSLHSFVGGAPIAHEVKEHLGGKKKKKKQWNSGTLEGG